MSPSASAAPHASTSHHWRKLPWVALALLLGAQLWLLPYPRVYLVFGPIRLVALGFVAAVTLLAFLVRSRSVKLAAVLLSALLFVRFVQLHRHLALLHELQAVASQACRGLDDSPEGNREAERRALVMTGRDAQHPSPFLMSCSAKGPYVACFDGFDSLEAFDAQGRLVCF